MKHVVVTGASKGLGEVLVRGLLASGYRISACSRSRSEFIEKMSADPVYGHYFFWKRCAVEDAADVSEFIDEAAKHAGGEFYGLINNAGIAGEGILATFPVADAARIIEVNLLGSLHMARAVLRQMLRSPSGGGRIINISSIIGSRGYTGLAAYSASKAGLDGLTRALAREVGRRGVTCNSIAPGYMLTEMSKSLSAAQTAQIVNRTPLNRLGEPADVLEAVKFLLSDGASFITGQTLIIDGGITC